MNTFDRRIQPVVQQSRRFTKYSKPQYLDLLPRDKASVFLSCIFVKDDIVSLIERPEEGFRIVNVLLNGNINKIKLVPYISLTYLDNTTAILITLKSNSDTNYELTWDEKDKPVYKKIV